MDMKIAFVDVYQTINEKGSPDFMTIMDLGHKKKLITLHWGEGIDRWERSFITDSRGDIQGSPSEFM